MPEEKKAKPVSCPNCLQPAFMIDNEITCENCDAVFAITRKQGAKVKQLGPIDDHEQRIKRLESLIPGEPEDKPEDQDDEPGDDSLL